MFSDICSDILSDILSGIYSDMLSGIYSDTLCGILSGICSDILSGIYSLILSGKCSDIHSLWHVFRSWRYGVRVQACPTASGAGDMARIHSCPQSDELAEARGGEGGRPRRRRTRRRRRSYCTFVKSREPHLADGEQCKVECETLQTSSNYNFELHTVDERHGSLVALSCCCPPKPSARLDNDIIARHLRQTKRCKN